MSAKWLGIGVVVATAAVGGYVALRSPEPTPASIPVTTHLPTPAPASASSLVEPEPASAPAVAPGQAGQAANSGRPTAGAARQTATTTTAPPARSQSAAAPIVADPVTLPTPPVEPPAVVEPQRYVPDPPQAPPVPVVTEPTFVELVVAKTSVIGITLDHGISTRTARLEDRVSARVSREVRVGGDVAIPEGAQLEGTVVVVERGGKFREAPRLGIRFSTLILPDNTRVAMSTDAIYRVGTAPTADATAKVGTGAVIGAVLGAVLGGKKGAILGGTAGAAGGAAAVANGDEAEVALKAGTSLTVRLTDDLAVLIRR